MYVPYMYGRQYELLAIRWLLGHTDRDLSQWLPLVEPVMARPNDLGRCMSMCQDQQQDMAVIVNPHRHQLKNSGARHAWGQAAWAQIDAFSAVVPTYRLDEQTTVAEISAFLARFSDRKLAMVITANALSVADTQWLASQAAIRWFVVLTDKVPAHVLALFPSTRTIWLKDCFARLSRNADYKGAEYFTDRHKTSNGKAGGIGDYLCLGDFFSAGGGAPGAVTIHAAFKEPQSQDVWIEHFVSKDQVQHEVDTAVKFLQAAKKLVKQVRLRPKEFGTNPALTEFERLVREDKFPQLATSKKLQMVHHMCLVMDVLQGRL
ncbi:MULTISPECIES: sce7725 family protein [Xanthomonas]|uniref:Uncharacterized protein n=1 Tax=Xanthomonas arboricola pv. corylina TaxID=487821 RepID=A0A8D6Y6P9_9XANT|nr:sce7725 family protein [Xanthomonas arboricola]MDN0209463.1 sce7725 family protein [Xanthomonas arboricola pv. corylina]MDN0213877.1 sce7725 family protein [Xanthomonas arboricola pv. corylina]UQQ09790.1 sce7725 family protein [Xanthomonas arboricola pv. corylina]CAE6768299.1 hypothetical protein CFBP1159_20990 [Xanthomonas arboricola pv. corylina]CAE6768334.1 hypothetical protein CFBP1159_20990 [Xanthomonas arboricola pv. corylina]